MNAPTTEAGRQLLYIHGERMREPVLAIEAEARALTYGSVLRGLRSERQTEQVRAIIASVEADARRIAAPLVAQTAENGPST